ncbi:hypothetical protein HPB52_012342 [Rhipicephalus sanguineus]|uniref:Uncharacterized protein n=1 Tax=Rhipicephalus sanguineus TaxID=34632 RepID=A0A9D4YPQ3_RHISA|nr:hypothetical protein HPB52_012342 [Rhipicephalus sanguineus]
MLGLSRSIKSSASPFGPSRSTPPSAKTFLLRGGVPRLGHVWRIRGYVLGSWAQAEAAADARQRAEVSDAGDPGSSQGTRPCVQLPPNHHLRRRCQHEYYISERGLACCSTPCRERRGSRRGVSTVSCSAEQRAWPG